MHVHEMSGQAKVGGYAVSSLVYPYQLQGRVEECCCDVETVDRLNQDRIFPVLSKLLTRPFFNFYQVNLNKRCPFWPDSSKCFMRSCHVEACTEVCHLHHMDLHGHTTMSPWIPCQCMVQGEGRSEGDAKS